MGAVGTGIGGDCTTFAWGAGGFPTDRLMMASATSPDNGNKPFSIRDFRLPFELLILASIQPGDTQRICKPLLLELETVGAAKLAAVAGFFSKGDKNRWIWLASRSAQINWEIVKILADMRLKGLRIRVGVIRFYKVSRLSEVGLNSASE